MRRRATGSSSPAGTARAVSDQRPWTAGCAAARGASRTCACARPARAATTPASPSSFGERSGANASLVASPAHTRSHSAVLQLLGREAADVGQQVGEEARRRPAAARGRPRGPAPTARSPALRRRADQRRVVAEVQRHAAGPAPERARADPHDLARRAQLVQPRGRVGAGAARQHVALPHLQRQRQPLERHEHLAQPVDARAGRRVAVDALPVRLEAREARAGRRARSRRAARPATRGAGGAAPRGRTTRACVPPGRSSPRTRCAGLLEPLQHRREVEAVAVAQRAASRTGRACGRSARTSRSIASGTSAMNASGRPDGGTAPSASRYSPASSAATQRFSPPTRSSIARRSPAQLLAATRACRRAASASSSVRSPTRRSTSCSASTLSARVRSDSRCRSASTVSSAPGSISSRSSSWPSSSRSSSRSSASAAARRSALGWSPSYMYVAT